MQIKFLGSGNSHSEDLGASSALIYSNDKPSLLIDIGGNTYHRLMATGELPSGVYLTHSHFDHISGMEMLFYKEYFDFSEKIKVYCHYDLVPLVSKKLLYINQIAEGGANFWDAFHLVPVDDHFYHDGVKYIVFENRHHAPKSSYGLACEGKFIYSGDTRPIPEMIGSLYTGGEIIFHDCCEVGNPSHTGIDDLFREYPEGLISEMMLYHLNNKDFRDKLEGYGLKSVENGVLYSL